MTTINNQIEILVIVSSVVQGQKEFESGIKLQTETIKSETRSSRARARARSLLNSLRNWRNLFRVSRATPSAGEEPSESKRLETMPRMRFSFRGRACREGQLSGIYPYPLINIYIVIQVE